MKKLLFSFVFLYFSALLPVQAWAVLHEFPAFKLEIPDPYSFKVEDAGEAGYSVAITSQDADRVVLLIYGPITGSLADIAAMWKEAFPAEFVQTDAKTYTMRFLNNDVPSSGSLVDRGNGHYFLTVFGGKDPVLENIVKTMTWK